MYAPPIDTEDEGAAEHARQIQAFMPYSIIGSTDDVTTADGRSVKGRQYLWGVAEGESDLWARALPADALPVENDDHCDFRRLRSLLIRTYMLDLVQSTEENHYEAYRVSQMETRKFGEPKVKKVDNPKFREEEELLRKRFTDQVKLEEARFRQWEQHVSGGLRFTGLLLTGQLIAERDRLNKDLEAAHSSIKAIEVSDTARKSL